MPVSALGTSYLSESVINPVLGRPMFAVLSYRWAGLSGANGDPQGVTGGVVSTNYPAIITSTKLDSMVYHGSIQPTVYGSLRNTVEWKNLSLSFIISYKGGYYFRAPSVNYSTLFNTWTGHAD
jgi:hypothetical protein